MKVKIKDLEFEVELADNFIKRAFGLMLRDIKDKAMLFKYGKRKVRVHTYFMLYPIDILFIYNNKVVDAVRLKPWKSYKSKVYSNMMLEFKSLEDRDVKKFIGEEVIFK
ncbi:DUF192 domain-containing protein [Methanocaldococcus infernus]